MHFKRHVVQARNLALDTQEGVMVDKALAAIDPVERGDDVVFFARIYFVRRHEPQSFAKPLGAGHDIRRHDHCMSEALHMRRSTLDPRKLAKA